MIAHEQYVGEVLARRGVVPPERLATLYETVRERAQTITDLIVAANIADEATIAQALADECGLQFVPRIDIDAVSLDLVSRLPITYAKQHKILPISEDDGVVNCAIADPFDTAAV